MAEGKFSEDRPRPHRKPYESPAVVETAEFERLVLACGHTPLEGEAGNPNCSGPATGMGQGANS